MSNKQQARLKEPKNRKRADRLEGGIVQQVIHRALTTVGTNQYQCSCGQIHTFGDVHPRAEKD